MLQTFELAGVRLLWLAPYRAFWSDRLDALARHLEANPE